MREIIKSRMFLTAVAITAVFWTFGALVPRSLLFDLLNAMAVAIGTGVIVAYAPGVIKTLQSRPEDISTGHILVVGIVCAWVAAVVRSGWNWAWRYLGKPDALIDHLGVAYLLVVLIMGGIAHLAAKDAINGQIPRESWRRIGIYTALGLAVGALVFLLLEPPDGH